MTTSRDLLRLYDIGSYPGARIEPSRGVEIEALRVDTGGRKKLDRLEDYRVRRPKTGIYDRAVHDTAFGPAWLYLYNRDVTGCPVIRPGGWPAVARGHAFQASKNTRST